ncbi:hypothetical protein HJG60_008397 [Phyllostomus discolor]|uniref:non-specific serine/threonine protein kinase n=1 Tax=Phyllostomus discolor TaxID=89673 RepID=A0A833Z8C1_9CHIR|nr:hypothetical protein HJG60_008397 [Phyllostomus discolor]
MPEDVSSTSDQECRIGGYLLLRTIGQGSFAKVMLARHIVTGTEVAVKFIRRGSSLALREVQCLKKLHHPNITRLFEVMATKNNLIMVMEHLSGGDLATYLQKHGAWTEEEARTIFRQLVSALHHCHEKGFAHRDLKPENILLDADNTIKLADFGFTKEVKHNLLSSFCGTATYMAPEIMMGQAYDGQRVDIWSLGVVLYQLVTGRLPFEGETYGAVKKRVLTGHFLLPHFLSEECQHLLQNIMTLDPAQRPTLDAIIKHPWVNRGQKEGVKLYSEPLCGDIDPQISEQMKQLGYDQEDVRESVAHKTFDHIMGTYLILRSTKRNIRGHTVHVRPCSSPEQRQHRPTTPELRAAGEKTNRSTSPPTKVPVRVPVRATSMAPKGAVSATGVAHRVAIPTTAMEVKLAIPSASSQGEGATPASIVPVELAVPSASSQGEGATPVSIVPVELAVPSARSEGEGATPAFIVPMELAAQSASSQLEVATPASIVPMELAVTSARSQLEVATPASIVPMELAVTSASSQLEVATPASIVPMELAIPSARSQLEVATPTSSESVQLAVTSASSLAEVATPTSSEPMELALTSASTEPEVVIRTSSLAWQVDISNASGEVKGAMKPEGFKSSTLSCPESSPATTSRALHHGSLRQNDPSGCPPSSAWPSFRLLTIISLILENDTTGYSLSSAWPYIGLLTIISLPIHIGPSDCSLSSAWPSIRLTTIISLAPYNGCQAAHHHQPGVPE